MLAPQQINCIVVAAVCAYSRLLEQCRSAGGSDLIVPIRSRGTNADRADKLTVDGQR
jgi:hypothetical protein